MRPPFLVTLTFDVSVLFLTCDFELRNVLIYILVDFLGIRWPVPSASLALLRVSTSVHWSSVRFKFLFHLKLRQVNIKVLGLLRLSSNLISCLLWLLTDFTAP